jgi:hypothetical protein
VRLPDWEREYPGSFLAGNRQIPKSFKILEECRAWEGEYLGKVRAGNRHTPTSLENLGRIPGWGWGMPGKTSACKTGIQTD